MLLEGLEVAFIVISFGGTQSRLGLAAAAAGAALVVVAGVGALLHAPLARVAENAVKYTLSGAGTSWSRARFAAIEWQRRQIDRKARLTADRDALRARRSSQARENEEPV